MITTTRQEGYVLNRVEGTLTIKELLSYAQAGVDRWLPDPVLWDLSSGKLTEDASDYYAVRATVENVDEMVEKRSGRKTAFVAPDAFTYGMLRMAITIVEVHAGHPIASVFSTVEEALEWLKQD